MVIYDLPKVGTRVRFSSLAHMKKPNILITNPLSPLVLSFLRKRSNIEVKLGISEIELVKKVKHYDAIICRSATRIRSCVLGAGSKERLRIVATATSGFDHINTITAKQLGIPVVHSPIGNTISNVEYIIGAMITISRNFFAADKLMRLGVWDQEAVVGTELYGKTFGSIGFGRIGSMVCERVQQLGMRAIAFDPYKAPEVFISKSVDKVSLDKLLRESDFVSLSLPLTEETKDLMKTKELSKVKRSTYIIQVSRGGVINEQDLLNFLYKRKIAGAVIDVFENEPYFRNEFRGLNNIILTPHYACSTKESRIRSGMTVANDIFRYLSGKKPMNLVPSF